MAQLDRIISVVTERHFRSSDEGAPHPFVPPRLLLGSDALASRVPELAPCRLETPRSQKQRGCPKDLLDPLSAMAFLTMVYMCRK